MSRRTWKKGNLYVSFGRPAITAFHDGTEVSSMSDVMYFYYDITILQENKVMMEMHTHDFPKVQNLPIYIDEIMNFNMEQAYLLDNYEHDGFIRRVKYHQVTLEDSFNLDLEYFYKIERYDYFVKQRHTEEPMLFTEYVMTIGNMEVSREYGGDDREDYGKCIMIKSITPDELIGLKSIAESFCKEAILLYNRERET